MASVIGVAVVDTGPPEAADMDLDLAEADMGPKAEVLPGEEDTGLPRAAGLVVA